MNENEVINLILCFGVISFLLIIVWLLDKQPWSSEYSWYQENDIKVRRVFTFLSSLPLYEIQINGINYRSDSRYTNSWYSKSGHKLALDLNKTNFIYKVFINQQDALRKKSWW